MTKLDELRELADEISSTNDPLARLDFASQVHFHIDALLDIAEAALSVCSENGAREYLLCYVQGARLLEALDKLK